jgi:hypothetical protein
MNYRVLMVTLATALLAMLPVLYLHRIWPGVLAFVPTHHGGGSPNRFVERAVLWNVAWFPAIACGVLTFLPQVQAGESWFWSSPRQRRVRLVVVAALALVVTLFIRSGAQDSRPTLRLPTRPTTTPR